MTQNVLDYSQNPSGIDLMDTYLAGMADNMLTTNSGVSRPSYAQAGTFWIDTSVSPWVLKQFNGTNDVVIGTLDQTNLYFTAQRALNDKNGNDITSTYLTTTGTAAKATADANGNVITSTYLTTSGTAAKATADANGDTITSTYAKLPGDNNYSGTNTFDNLKLKATRPVLLANDNNTEGGELRFESAPNEATTGIMYIARSNGKFVFVGVDSSQTIKFPFVIDIQTDTVDFSAPAQSGINGKVMPNYAAYVSKTKGVPYIADSNGYLIGYDQYQGTSGSYNAYVYINGVNVRVSPTQDNYSLNTWCYPISKGSSYSYSGSANMEMFFVPAVGG